MQVNRFKENILLLLTIENFNLDCLIRMYMKAAARPTRYVVIL